MGHIRTLDQERYEYNAGLGLLRSLYCEWNVSVIMSAESLQNDLLCVNWKWFVTMHY